MKFTKKIMTIATCAVMAASSMIGINASAATKTLAVPFFEQETNYYCSAATFQQVYAYYKGVNNVISQSTVASLFKLNEYGELNNLNTLTDWLNRYFYQDLEYGWQWRGGAYTNSTELYEKLKACIDSDVPPILHIYPNTVYWDYRTSSGHYLNASGYTSNSNGTSIQVTDPYLDGHGIASGKYYNSISDLYQVCDRIAVDIS